MSEKELTVEQTKKIDDLKKQFSKKVMQVPESLPPYNKLDGGGGRFHDLGVEFQNQIKKIIEEEQK